MASIPNRRVKVKRGERVASIRRDSFYAVPSSTGAWPTFWVICMPWGTPVRVVHRDFLFARLSQFEHIGR